MDGCKIVLLWGDSLVVSVLD